MFLTLFFAHKSSAGHNNSSLSGTYVIYKFGSGFRGGDPGAWGANDELGVEKMEFVFDGAGNFTSSYNEDEINRELLDTPVDWDPGAETDWVLQNTYNTTYSTYSDTDSGTYSVASDGTITITSSDGSGTAMLSSDGNTIVFSEVIFEASNQWGEMSFAVGVKQVKGYGDELALDFGSNGLWHYNGSTWTSLASWDPDGMVDWTGGMAVDFGATYGLWNYDGTTWNQLAGWNPEDGIAWNSGLAVDFGGNGLWHHDGSSWTSLASWDPDGMVEWAGGLAIDFDTYGTWNYDGTTWTQLAGWNPEDDMVSWTDGLAVDFGPNGLWSYDGSSWTSLAGWNPEEMEGWTNGLAVDFGAVYGLWNYCGSAWSNLAGWDPEDIIDVDLY